MIILSDRNISRSRFLVPVSKSIWSPSLTLPKDDFGNDIERTNWRLRAISNDGVVVWTGYFYDRDEADAFLFAIATGTLKQQRALWDFPTPNWQPYLGELISYEFVTQTFLTGTGSSSWSDPGDFPQGSNNRIDCIGSGGSGAAVKGTGSQRASGGGGGGWSSSTNLSVTFPASYSCGTGGTAVTRSTTGATNGNAGGDTTFNSTTIVAKGGGAGLSATTATATNGGSGGVASSGTGSTKVNGGNGGNITGTNAGLMATGGGGAGGPGSGNSGSGAAGNAGTNTANSGSYKGGQGGGTAGGAAGDVAVAVDGGNGAEYDATHGSGGGGSGYQLAFSFDFSSGNGGNYGGGGGGVVNGGSGNPSSGAGRQGLIYVEYTPATSAKDFPNLAMIGM